MQFHRNFRLIFSLNLSENAQNVHFGEAPDLPSLLAPSALDTIWAGLTLNCFRQAGYFQSVTLTMILRILRPQKDVSFLSRKGCTKGLLKRDQLKLKVHPQPKKLRTCLLSARFCANSQL